MAELFTLPNVKAIRAEVIKSHLPSGTERIVCLSCGNASKALEETIDDVPIVAVDRDNPILTTREISIDELRHYFGPGALNATSGYLPLDWMETIGQKLAPLIPRARRYYVPCGSGETIMSLAFFVPLPKLVAVTASYPPIEMMGPLARWLRGNVEVRHAGRVGSVKEALEIVADGPGLALCWE